MRKNYRLPGFVLILIGIIVGGLIFSNLTKSSSPFIYADNNNNKTIDSLTQAAQRPIRTLKDLNNAFVDIAKAVNPTVVTVFIEKVYKVNTSPFFNDPFGDFFGNFFKNPNLRQNRPKQRKYIQEGMGSGVIVSSNGYIITNNHVVQGANKVKVTLMDGRTLSAKVIGTDPKTDIALIKINAKNLPTIKFGNSDNLHVGDLVLAIGSPLSPNLEHTVTMGIVSAKGRTNMGLADYEDFIQTDAAINPGNSGGALVNMNGQLVGINSAIATQSGGFQGIGFAVPVNMVRTVMESLKKYGKVIRGYLGAYIQDVNATMAQAMKLPVKHGAIISDLVKGGPAAKAGIKSGDVVIRFNGKKITSSRQFRYLVAATPPGTEVHIIVLRHGKKKEINVKLGTLKSQHIAVKNKKKLQKLFGFNVAQINSRTIKKYNLPEAIQGVLVTSVNNFSAAASAGLRPGDVILAMNGKKIDGLDSFNNIASKLKKGDSVFLRVQRGNRKFFAAFSLN
jgi:serine protease Do